MSFQHIETAVENHICFIKLNRPEIRNALVPEMRKELIELFQQIEQDHDVKAIILTGEGNTFSAGGDLSGLKNQDAISGRNRLKGGQELIQAILNLEKPVIAAVNGAAAGAGFSLALACDMVYAARSAFFIQSFVKVGLVPDLGAIHFLPRLIGPHRAKELMFMGDRISADRAYQLGLLNDIVDDHSLLDRVFSVAAKLAEGPSISIGLTKRLVNRNVNAGLDETLELEAFAQGFCFETEDFQEGVHAFFSKRSPQFNGK